MSQILSRCVWLKAALSELMGEKGRRFSVFDCEDMPSGRPDGWQSWVPWTAVAPHPWVVFVLARCKPLSDAVRAIRGVWDELGTFWRGAADFRSDVGTYLESGLLGRPWLVEILRGDCYTRYDAFGELQGPADEWVLVTAPIAAAKLDGLIELAERARQEQIRSAKVFDALFEVADPTTAAAPSSGERGLTYVDQQILAALDQRSLTADELAEASKCSRRHVIRRITDRLEPAELVKNIQGLGYYRPDRPSRAAKEMLKKLRRVTK